MTRYLSKCGQVIMLLACATATLLAAASMPPREQRTPTGVDGRAARRHIVELSERIGRRVAGSPNEALAADYVTNVFRQMGYVPVVQWFSFSGGSRGGPSTEESANIVAVTPGQSTREIIVGAHYDSEVRGRGAGDNASGVGVMLEVALSIRDVSTPYTIRFIAFGAEEEGLRGSRHYVNQMTPEAIENTVAMINLDSLIAGEIAYVYGDAGEAGLVRNWVLERAREERLDLGTQLGENPEFPAGTTGDFSDHAPFEDAGIPYAYFESTNWALGDKDGYVQVDPQLGEDGYIWHTEFDSLEYIEETFPGRAAQRLLLFSQMLYRILTEFVVP